jgi:hypothetical protein
VPSTGHDRPPGLERARRHRLGLHAPRPGARRAPSPPGRPPADGRGWSEFLSSASVILAGVLVVVGFAFIAARAIRGDDSPGALPDAPDPTPAEVTQAPPSQALIPLESPSPHTTTVRPAPDPGAVAISRADVPATVDLSAEGTQDWVHWGGGGTSAPERDKKGRFAILEGAPVAPRFRHAMSPQRFGWSGGDPVAASAGTPTGIRTCGEDEGFTLSAPAGTKIQVLRLYVGVLAGKGRLEAKLSNGRAAATAGLEQRGGELRTAVLTVTYRAPRDGRLTLKWITQEEFGPGCGGVALQAATLR